MILSSIATPFYNCRKCCGKRLLIAVFAFCFYIPLIFDSKSINSFTVDAVPVAQPQLLADGPPSSSSSGGQPPVHRHREAFSALTMIEFMQRYGYLEKGAPDAGEALYSEYAISDAIKTVQKFGGLTETGYLDEETAKLMASPRCGVADFQRRQRQQQSPFRRGRGRRRQRRFVVGARPWMKRRITYFLANWSPKVGQQEMAEDMRKAFDEWSKYSRLKFVQVFSPDADIIVGFGSGHHGDNYPFDGPGNILAHAYYPYEMGSLGGDIHFDNDEPWTRNSSNPTDVNFLSVAVHELGHSLGLGHSPVHNSIMFPYYKATSSSSSTGPAEGHQLAYDDVLAMYNLYILRASTLVDEDDGADDDDMATEPTTGTSAIPPSTERTTTTTGGSGGVSDDEEALDRIWPGIYSTTERGDQPATGAASPNNVTYHFHGDYETVDAHKKRFNYPEYTPPMDVIPSTTARPTLFHSWWTAHPRRHGIFATTAAGRGFGDWESSRSRGRNNNRLSSVANAEDEEEERNDQGTTAPARRRPPDVWEHVEVEQRQRPAAAPADDICSGNFDAITAINENVFVFRDKFVWRFDANLAAVRGYPVPISQQFPGVSLGRGGGGGGTEPEGTVDAVYQRQTDGAVVIFADHRFWIIDGSDFQLPRPSAGGGAATSSSSSVHYQQSGSIWELGLPRNVSKIDGIFLWPKNQKAYLFAGNEFWRFSDDRLFGSLEAGYPKSVSRWHGIPFHIDGVVVMPRSGRTMFFKNNSYWLFNDHWVRPALGYPKLVRSLFNC